MFEGCPGEDGKVLGSCSGVVLRFEGVEGVEGAEEVLGVRRTAGDATGRYLFT